MKTYRVKNWPVIDDNGNTREAGETVELSDEKARFYSGRLQKVEPEEEAEKEDPTSDNSFQALPEDTEFPYHYGGGNYFLSNGEKVSGKQDAIEAQKELDNELSNTDRS